MTVVGSIEKLNFISVSCLVRTGMVFLLPYFFPLVQ